MPVTESAGAELAYAYAPSQALLRCAGAQAAARYSRSVWVMSVSTLRNSRTPEVLWPALQMSRPRRGRFALRFQIDVLGDVDRAALRQRVRIEAGGDDRRTQHVSLQAGEGAGEHHVVGRGGNQHLLIGRRRETLMRGNKARAHIGEITAKRDGGMKRVAVADAACEHDRPGEELTYRAHEGEGIEPAGLPAGARGQQHEALGSRAERALGVPDRGDIGEDERARLVQRTDHARWRADAGDDDFRRVREHDGKIVGKALVRGVHDQVRAEGGGRGTGRVLMLPQAPADGRKPLRKLLGRPAIGGRKRADHAVPAGGDDEIDAGDAEHRRRDQWQAHALSNAGEARVFGGQRCFLGE